MSAHDIDFDPRDPLLRSIGVEHAFGTRDARAPEGLLRPQQVHGRAVAVTQSNRHFEPREADAIVCNRPGVAIGIASADCVPILLATSDGSAVACVHAGWRGLALGVVAAGVDALRQCAPSGQALTAAIGPAAGLCCYEVDEPVLTALQGRFGPDTVQDALRHSRPGHARVDLASLAQRDLQVAGVLPSSISRVCSHCTICNPDRFYSYRRDGEHAGRLVHHIASRDLPAAP
jgi:YfiH family protein